MVATPYTMDDLKAVLAEVSGDRAFADGYFSRYIQGHEVVDYGALLSRAGLVMRKRETGAVLVGANLTFGSGGARVTGAALFGSALYKAGLDRDDLIVSIGGVTLSSRTR